MQSNIIVKQRPAQKVPPFQILDMQAEIIEAKSTLGVIPAAYVEEVCMSRDGLFIVIEEKLHNGQCFLHTFHEMYEIYEQQVGTVESIRFFNKLNNLILITEEQLLEYSFDLSSCSWRISNILGDSTSDGRSTIYAIAPDDNEIIISDYESINIWKKIDKHWIAYQKISATCNLIKYDQKCFYSCNCLLQFQQYRQYGENWKRTGMLQFKDGALKYQIDNKIFIIGDNTNQIINYYWNEYGKKIINKSHTCTGNVSYFHYYSEKRLLIVAGEDGLQVYKKDNHNVLLLEYTRQIKFPAINIFLNASGEKLVIIEFNH